MHTPGHGTTQQPYDDKRGHTAALITRHNKPTV